MTEYIYLVGFKATASPTAPLAYRAVSFSASVVDGAPGVVWEFHTTSPAELEQAFRSSADVEMIVRPAGLPLIEQS